MRLAVDLAVFGVTFWLGATVFQNIAAGACAGLILAGAAELRPFDRRK